MTIRNIFLPFKRNPQTNTETAVTSSVKAGGGNDVGEEKRRNTTTPALATTLASAADDDDGGTTTALMNSDNDSSRISQGQQPRYVVLETPSAYSPVIYALVAFTLGSTLIGALVKLSDDSISQEEAQDALWPCAFSFLSVAIVFGLVLPRSLQVRSDASLGVQTALVTWTFADIVAAHENPPLAEQCTMRPRFKFATTLWTNRVLVQRRRRCRRGRRRNHPWDVLVSPLQADEFCRAVRQVAEVAGEEEGDHQHYHHNAKI